MKRPDAVEQAFESFSNAPSGKSSLHVSYDDYCDPYLADEEGYDAVYRNESEARHIADVWNAVPEIKAYVETLEEIVRELQHDAA